MRPKPKTKKWKWHEQEWGETHQERICKLLWVPCPLTIILIAFFSISTSVLCHRHTLPQAYKWLYTFSVSVRFSETPLTVKHCRLDHSQTTRHTCGSDSWQRQRFAYPRWQVALSKFTLNLIKKNQDWKCVIASELWLMHTEMINSSDSLTSDSNAKV